MLHGISLARTKGFELVDENTLKRNDCEIHYIKRNKNPYKVVNKKLSKQGKILEQKVTHKATLYAALRSVL